MRVWDKSKPPRGPFTLNRDCERAQGLAAWYPWGSIYGAQYVPDLAGTNELTGTAITATLGEAGQPAGIFNGSTSKASASIVVLGAPPVSIAAWVNPTTVAGNYGIACQSKFADSGLNRYQFDNNAGSLRWILVGNGAGNASAAKTGFTANRWQHVLGVEDPAPLRFVAIDGVAGTTDATSKSNGGFDTTMFGCLSDTGVYGSFFPGQIAEVCFWNKAWKTTDAAGLADLGQRFLLYYPLRSRKWISIPAALNVVGSYYYRNVAAMGGGMSGASS